jgi:conjugative transfer signal peptidase TraF
VTARVGVLAVMAVALIVAPSLIDLPMNMIWNASPSVPTGLYWRHPASDLSVGDLVVVTAPAALADFLSQRGYLPAGMPLLKLVAALAGQDVCRVGLEIIVDGVLLGTALAADHSGRPLPVWQDCRRVQAGDIFLMNPDVSDSFDGRYFGPISARSILGRAIPIWTFDRPYDAAGSRPIRSNDDAVSSPSQSGQE